MAGVTINYQGQSQDKQGTLLGQQQPFVEVWSAKAAANGSRLWQGVSRSWVHPNATCYGQSVPQSKPTAEGQRSITG